VYRQLLKIAGDAFQAARGKPLAPLDGRDIGLGGKHATAALLVVMLILGFALRLGLAATLPSVYFPDETFQYWEQGYRLVFGYGIVPWEYRLGIRSWVVPGFIGGVMGLVHQLGGGPAISKLAVQALLSIASLGIVVTAFAWTRRLSGDGAAVLAAFVASFWYEFVYFSPKPLTEIIAASALFPAAYLLCALPDPSRRAVVSGGLLLGVAFVLRFHLAPAILVIGLATMLRLRTPRWAMAAAAGVVVVLLAGLLDWITWGIPFHSFWQSVAINMIEGRAATFGTQPVFWYFLLYANAWPGIAIILLALILVGARRAPLLFLVPLVILVSHSLIGHKEYRFLYPGLPFLMTLASIGAAELFALTTRTLSVPERRLAFAALVLTWLLTTLTIAGTDGFRPNWTKRADLITLFDKVRDAPDACGLGLQGEFWWDTPGYSALGRKLPMYFIRRDEYARVGPAFNLLIHRDDDAHNLPAEFEDLQCEGGFCLAMRAGSCAPQPDEEILVEMQDWT